MKIKFCGAAQTVTGSAHLLTLDNGFKILIDCGLYQGNDPDFDDFNNDFLFKPKDIDAVVLTHAHIDHSGRLPKLIKEGFEGRIYSTHATRDLAAIMLLDSAHIQERNAHYINKRKKLKGKDRVEPLYDVGDVQNTMEDFICVGYNKWLQINEECDILFRDAGHILGSSNVTFRVRKDNFHDKYVGFTGDIGRPNRPILRNPRKMPECDFVICESTYGGKKHNSTPQDKEELLQIIKRACVEKNGKLIIPAFSVGRTQEIVYMLDQLENEKRLPKIPVYVDSPLAINATDIFQAHPDCFDRDILRYMHEDPNPFGFNNLHYVRNVEESKKINSYKKACIIISASGMMQAGRVKHHIFNNIEDEKNTLLIVGYCSPNTLGGILRNKPDKVKIFGEEMKVNFNIEVMDSFSAHGDEDEMIDFLQNQKNKAKNVFLVHGDLERQQLFEKALHKNGFDRVTIPALGESFVL